MSSADLPPYRCSVCRKGVSVEQYVQISYCNIDQRLSLCTEHLVRIANFIMKLMPRPTDTEFQELEALFTLNGEVMKSVRRKVRPLSELGLVWNGTEWNGENSADVPVTVKHDTKD